MKPRTIGKLTGSIDDELLLAVMIRSFSMLKYIPDPYSFGIVCLDELKRDTNNWDYLSVKEKFIKICITNFAEEVKTLAISEEFADTEMAITYSTPIIRILLKYVFNEINWDPTLKKTQIPKS